jgi:hypothetical protein
MGWQRRLSLARENAPNWTQNCPKVTIASRLGVNSTLRRVASGLLSNLRSTVSAKAPTDATARAVLMLPLMAAAADGKIEPSELDILSSWRAASDCHLNPSTRFLR